MPTHPRNYDDWNEHFWTLRTMARLCSKGGQPLMVSPPVERWSLLLTADWHAFFGGCAKTHKELRWWWNLLAANRRIWLVHILGFAACFVGALPDGALPDGALTKYAASGTTWDFNGYASFRVLPLVFLAAPLLSALGAAFEYWAAPTNATLSNLRNVLLGFGLVVAVVVVNLTTQVQYSYSEVAEELAQLSSIRNYDWFSTYAWIVTTWAVLLVVGPAWIYLALLPEQVLTFDANLNFEKRVRALTHSTWVHHGRVRGALFEFVRLYTFWGIVWACKLIMARFFLLPKLFDIQDAIFEMWSEEAVADAARLGGASSALAAAAKGDPVALIQYMLVTASWIAGATAYVADSLLWYQAP